MFTETNTVEQLALDASLEWHLFPARTFTCQPFAAFDGSLLIGLRKQLNWSFIAQYTRSMQQGDVG
ncbi:MAG: hypothetical protein ACK5YR_09215 [Pirellula sp.]|jgi:hypothetical protein